MKLKSFFKRKQRQSKASKDKSKNCKTKGGSKEKKDNASNAKADVAPAAPPASPAKSTSAKTSLPPASPTSVAAAMTTSGKSKPEAVADFDAKVFRKEEIETARKAGPVDLDDDDDADDAVTTPNKTEEEFVSDLIESLGVALPETKTAACAGSAPNSEKGKYDKSKEKTPKKAKKKKGKDMKAGQTDKPEAVHVDGLVVNDDDKAEAEAEEEEIRDYNTNVTRLFAYLHQRKWTRAVEHIITEGGRREASIWVGRYEEEEKEEQKNEQQQQQKKKKLVWKLLPIHAAIVYNAPPEVVQIVIRKYPDGCSKVDDRGCTPLHLAIGKGSASAQVIAMLVRACPDSVDMTDRRGRTPLDIAEELSPTESPRRAEYLDILQNKVDIEEVLLDRMTADDVSMVSADSILQNNGGRGQNYSNRNCAGFCFDDDSGDDLTMSGWSCNDSAWFPGCESERNDTDPSKSGYNNCVKDVTILEEIAEIC